ncbi:response regulator transcription factor [Bacillus sp. B1-b2]|uniref:response regulator transcription factor n=1 Tax=Bacillus sp. B1-b2 TaxID=2653201 RepID=UPI001261A797|nr:response regulator transcription factor [Bacillus sp. B1-b2]KAB7670765.1 response regulator transcription factor [Bacillus sp. B1-b2]
MTNILIVDVDKEIAELIEVYLKNEGYVTTLASNGIEALHILEQTNPDLIVLDIMMPKMDGLEFCKNVRKDNHLPILMVSAKVEDMDKIIGLMTGADDYMIKPFNPLELIARVKALLRRANYKQKDKEEDILYVRSLIIDKQSHTLTTENGLIKLTAREFDILYLLAKNRGRVFSSEELFERVWKESCVGSNQTVMVHISNLREKLEAAVPGETFIQTVWGVGYKIEK